jgi:hypothetical protein
MIHPAVEVGRWDERALGGRAAGIPSSPQAYLEHLDALAWMLDSSIQIPGTRFRIGVDAVIGLIPVIGDLIGAAFSTYILATAARMGVPRVTLMRMGFNIAVESVVGLVPVAGDVFDMAWKANRRNVDLLREHAENPEKARRGSLLFAASLVGGIVALLSALAWAGWSLSGWAWNGASRLFS